MVMAALAMAQDVGTLSPGGVEAIGPKQDDPRAMCEPGETSGMLSAGRVRVSSSSGMKPTPGGVMAIGPKQDDPRSPGTLNRPGDDEDPHAAGGAESIGPKQDDPRSPNLVARPGDDEDPHALAMAGKCGAKAR
jgi:hypothetical protein